MKRENISRAILIALVVAAGVEGKWFSSAALTAHATQTQGRSLPTFEVGGMRLVKRLTLIIRSGRIEHVFYPVFPPNESAVQVMRWLRANP